MLFLHELLVTIREYLRAAAIFVSMGGLYAWADLSGFGGPVTLVGLLILGTALSWRWARPRSAAEVTTVSGAGIATWQHVTGKMSTTAAPAVVWVFRTAHKPTSKHLPAAFEIRTFTIVIQNMGSRAAGTSARNYERANLRVYDRVHAARTEVVGNVAALRVS